MAEQRPGILQIYREIIHEPLTAYQEVAGSIPVTRPIISMAYLETARSLLFLGLQVGYKGQG